MKTPMLTFFFLTEEKWFSLLFKYISSLNLTHIVSSKKIDSVIKLKEIPPSLSFFFPFFLFNSFIKHHKNILTMF